MTPKCTVSDTLGVYFSCINIPVGVLVGGQLSSRQRCRDPTSLSWTSLKTLSPFVLAWKNNKEGSSTVPPPKALACITLLASGGKISVTWPHFTARWMGNEAWLCARVKETLDLVRRSAVPTRVGVVSPPGDLLEPHPSSITVCPQRVKPCAKCWPSRKK